MAFITNDDNIIEDIATCIVHGIEDEQITLLDTDNVFTDVNPNREWQGLNTLEISFSPQKVYHDLSGNSWKDGTLTVAIKTVDKSTAMELKSQVFDYLDRLLSGEQEDLDSVINLFVIDEIACFPDVEGNTVQESYWAVLRYKIMTM